MARLADRLVRAHDRFFDALTGRRSCAALWIAFALVVAFNLGRALAK